MGKTIFDQIKNLVTESVNEKTANIDEASVLEILRLINDEDRKIPGIVGEEIPYIAHAVDLIVESFNEGGKLIYVGAGTSGRLGVLDASECPPTFGVPQEMVQGIIAGGLVALVEAQEGAEDDFDQGAIDLSKKNISANDVVCGIAASRRTPYVIGAIEYARKQGAKTLYVTCNPREKMDIPVDVAICPVVGPEVVMGSTRMKAGTATKLVLNMLTTTSMIRLGKVYGNMMVDLLMTSKKLEERSKRILMMTTGIDYETADEKLSVAKGHLKTALVMVLADCSLNDAKVRLEQANGFVKKAIQL